MHEPDKAAESPTERPLQDKTRGRWKRRTPWIATSIALFVMAYLSGAFGYYWREAAELHDGRQIIVTRYQTYGGRHEIGQGPPISLQRLSFTVPETGERVTWESDTTKDIGRVNLLALAVHILNGTPYVISEPHLCLAYNKWGRPDPPYVLFKYENREWKRIPIEELPAEFKTLNLVINTKSHHKEITNFIRNWTVQPERIRKLNSSLKQLEYRSIVREPVRGKSVGSHVGCEEVVWIDGQKSWIGARRFTSRNSLEDCNAICAYSKISAQDCPCNRFFSEE